MGFSREGTEGQSHATVSQSGRPIRAITFDVGHTLLTPAGSVGQVYADIAARYGCAGLVPEELDQRFQATFAAQGWIANTREEWSRIVDATFAGLVPQLPSLTFFEELYERFGRRAAWQMYPDVRPALRELTQRGFRLGIISNWDERLRPLLAEFELDARFEVIVISCETGFSKPAPEIFRAAVAQFQLAPGEILHVGDSWAADVQGARAVGMASRQISREQPPVTDRIGSLLELVAAASFPH